jgi:hypothetical protein
LTVRRLARWSTITGFAILAVIVAACAQILGVDDGLPLSDGGDERRDGRALSEAGSDRDAREERDARDERIDGSREGKGDAAPEEASTDARDAQPMGDARHVTCTTLADFCVSRCGPTMDNCGNPIDCGGCDGGLTCTAGGCGCVPVSTSIACGQQNCSTQKNNCGQVVACGVEGTAGCEHSTDVCEAEGGTCCTPPAPSVTCGNQCGVTVTNACGQPVTCGCGDAGVCQGGSCCVPVAATVWCQGRCGVTTENCGTQINCGGCAGSLTCGANHTCGCVPDPESQTCAGQQCGYATNNCGSPVFCGTCSGNAICDDGGVCCEIDASACGTTVCNTTVASCGLSLPCSQMTCNGGEVCLTSSSTCCIPESPNAACVGKACGATTNNCGAPVACTDTCDGGVCGGGQAGPNGCCYDDGTACGAQCSGTAVDNCGVTVGCHYPCGPSQTCGASGTCCNVSTALCSGPADCCSLSCTDAGTCN